MKAIRGVVPAAAVLVATVLGGNGLASCVGDCDSSGAVTVADLKTGIDFGLSGGNAAICGGLDRGDGGVVTVDDLVFVVAATLDNICLPNETVTATVTPLDATPTATPTETATETATETSTPDSTSTPTPTESPAGPIIFSVAGNGIFPGLNGDGLPPLETQLYLPQDVTIGPDGLVYIVDWNNHRIRRIKDGLIETVAGTGELGDAAGDVALYANFNHPTNVEFDHDGTMLVSAWHNSNVKRVDLTTGALSAVACDGSRAYAGEGVPATTAKCNLPSSTVVDSNGNIFISDQANFRVRVVDSTGMINTVIGTGTKGYGGDGGRALDAKLNGPAGQAAAPASRLCIDHRNNNIYVTDTSNHIVRLYNAGDATIDTVVGTPGQAGYTGDTGPARQATLNTPSDCAVGDDGTLYIADTYNNVVRIVTPDGTIDTLAGTGEAGFSGDGGLAKVATLDRPYGLTVTSAGEVYVADTENHHIRKIVLGDSFIPPTPKPEPTPAIVPCTDEVGSICTYLGTGKTEFNGDGLDRVHTAVYWPFDIEFLPNSGRTLFLDWNNHKVREVLPDNTIVTRVGTVFVGDGPADLSDLTPPGADGLTVSLNHPTDLQEFPNGDIAVMCWHNHKIRVIDHESGLVRVLMGAGPGGFPMPGDGVAAKTALVNQPPHGVFDPQGDFFFIDQRNQRIRVLMNYATDRENAIVQTVVGVGVTGLAPGGFNGDGLTHVTQINFPTGTNPEPSGGLTVDPNFSTNHTLYFSDTNNHRIRMVQFFDATFSNGSVTTIAGTGTAGFSGDNGPATMAEINYPEDLEMGPDGNLYFADTNNHRIRMIFLDQSSESFGNIVTVAGSGEKGYSGDGGPALEAQLNRPFGIAFDGEGDLYVSDTYNSRIRKVKR